MTRVVIRTRADDGKLALLDEVVSQAGLWSALAEAVERSPHRSAPEDLHVVIKPDMNLLGAGSPTGTDPELVEHLIELLVEHGYVRVTVAGARGLHDAALENTDAISRADLVGYGFQTPRGHPYDVVDLGDPPESLPFPAHSVLHRVPVADAWTSADFRISFAKNKTEQASFYALNLQNLLEIVPSSAWRAGRRRPGDVVVALLEATPVHFALIDAFVSSHGNDGANIPRPLSTRTLIAGPSVGLVDWVAAMKMGLDPHASPVGATVFRAHPMTPDLEIDGDLEPYDGWRNVHPLLSESAIEPESGGAPLIEPPRRVDTELFPHRDLRYQKLNDVLVSVADVADDNPMAFWGLASIKLGLASARRTIDAWRTLFAKERLHRREVPFGLDLSRFDSSDYEAVVDYMRPLETVIASTPPDGSGLRWRYLDGSVLFRYERIVPASYDDFVSHVDIAKAVQLMNDFIGGMSVPVQRDASGRVTHQATRTIYLPQPNFMVLYGGSPIDVSKLELVEYGPRFQKVYWRTVGSLNGSAEHDDGSVTFTDRGREGTEVVVVARQKFRLPLYWQVVNLDVLNPALKDWLVATTYRSYFEQTIANFEACYEGREYRIGAPFEAAGPGEPDAAPVGPMAPLVETALRASRRITETARENRGGVLRLVDRALGEPEDVPFEVDAAGFRHFRRIEGPEGDRPRSPAPATEARRALGRLGRATRSFVRDLSDALKKDLGFEDRR